MVKPPKIFAVLLTQGCFYSDLLGHLISGPFAWPPLLAGECFEVEVLQQGGIGCEANLQGPEQCLGVEG